MNCLFFVASSALGPPIPRNDPQDPPDQHDPRANVLVASQATTHSERRPGTIRANPRAPSARVIRVRSRPWRYESMPPSSRSSTLTPWSAPPILDARSAERSGRRQSFPGPWALSPMPSFSRP